MILIAVNIEIERFLLEIGQYGVSGLSDTNLLAIHGPIADTDFPKFLNVVFCFIIKNIMYSMPYLYFKNFKNQNLSAKKISIFCYDY